MMIAVEHGLIQATFAQNLSGHRAETVPCWNQPLLAGLSQATLQFTGLSIHLLIPSTKGFLFAIEIHEVPRSVYNSLNRESSLYASTIFKTNESRWLACRRGYFGGRFDFSGSLLSPTDWQKPCLLCGCWL